MSKTPLFDASALTLDTLFDASYGTQQDYLYELEAVTPTAIDTTTNVDSTNVRAADLTLALSRLDQETFSIIDLLPRNPQLHSSGQHHDGAKKRRLLNFPTSTLASAHTARPRPDDVPISRIAVLSNWQADFGVQLRRLKLSQLKKHQNVVAVNDEEQPIDQATSPQRESGQDNSQHLLSQSIRASQGSQPTELPASTAPVSEEVKGRTFVTMDIFDGEDLWTAAITFGDMRIVDSDSLSHVYRFLVYGKSLENPKLKAQLLVRGYIERVSDTTAKLHLYRSDPLFHSDGVKMTLSTEDPKAFIARLFVASYKRQILTQNLLTNLLYSLRTIQDSTMEVLKESHKLSESAKSAKQDFLEKVLAVVNSKKDKIAELEARLGAKEERQESDDASSSYVELKQRSEDVKDFVKPKARAKAKAKAKAKSKSVRTSKPRRGRRVTRSSDEEEDEADEDDSFIVPDPSNDFSSDSSSSSPPSESEAPSTARVTRRQTRRSTQGKDKREPSPPKGHAKRRDVSIDLFSGWASDKE